MHSFDDAPVLRTFFSAAAGTGEPGWGQEHYPFITGVVSLVLLVVVALMSLKVVRRLQYETFYFTHFLVLGAILFAYFHTSTAIFFCIPGLVLWSADGILRLGTYRTRYRVADYIQEPGRLRTVTVATPLGRGLEPGQFFRVCVPGVSGAQYHALCAASATDASLTFVFGVGGRSSSGGGGWAARTAEHIAGRVAAGEPAWVRLQGPFGDGSRLAATSAGDGGELGCLVAYVGGSGVAMGLAVLRAVMERRAAAVAASTAAAAAAAAAPTRFRVSADGGDDYAEQLDLAAAGAGLELKAGGGVGYLTVGGEAEEAEHKGSGGPGPLGQVPGVDNGAPPLYLFWSAAAAGLEETSLVTSLVRAARRSGAALTVHVFDTSEPGLRGADGDVVDSTPLEKDKEAGWEPAATAATAAGEEGRVRVLRSRGRPYLRTLLNRHVLESATRERAAASRAQRPAAAVGLFVCGPERFLEDAVESAAAFEGDHGLRVDLETVSYSL
ncbi:hypothetical protein HK405_012695 [Cladochytrium tenue]|nr:hypothetical protein HK405_012695 [Cladochytrium tenue]